MAKRIKQNQSSRQQSQGRGKGRPRKRKSPRGSPQKPQRQAQSRGRPANPILWPRVMASTDQVPAEDRLHDFEEDITVTENAIRESRGKPRDDNALLFDPDDEAKKLTSDDLNDY